MSAKIHKDIILKEEIKQLLDWFWKPDNFVWDSPFAYSKTVAGITLQPEMAVRIKNDYWPEKLILDIVKRIKITIMITRFGPKNYKNAQSYLAVGHLNFNINFKF